MPHSPIRRPDRTRSLTRCLAALLFLAAAGSGCTDRDGATPGASLDAEPKRTPKQLFVDSCASCHGVDGRGDGPMAAELREKPINLRLLKQENGGNFPTRDVQRSIDGRAMPRAHGLPKMPVWGRYWIRQGLSEAEVQARTIAIASYIASIQD